jgi:hypothetical protein
MRDILRAARGLSWGKLKDRMMTEIELWRPIAGFEAYEVSNMGRVRRSLGGKGTRGAKHILSTHDDTHGYLIVNFGNYILNSLDKRAGLKYTSCMEKIMTSNDPDSAWVKELAQRTTLTEGEVKFRAFYKHASLCNCIRRVRGRVLVTARLCSCGMREKMTDQEILKERDGMAVFGGARPHSA